MVGDENLLRGLFLKSVFNSNTENASSKRGYVYIYLTSLKLQTSSATLVEVPTGQNKIISGINSIMFNFDSVGKSP